LLCAIFSLLNSLAASFGVSNFIAFLFAIVIGRTLEMQFFQLLFVPRSNFFGLCEAQVFCDIGLLAIA